MIINSHDTPAAPGNRGAMMPTVASRRPGAICGTMDCRIWSRFSATRADRPFSPAAATAMNTNIPAASIVSQHNMSPGGYHSMAAPWPDSGPGPTPAGLCNSICLTIIHTGRACINPNTPADRLPPTSPTAMNPTALLIIPAFGPKASPAMNRGKDAR